MAYELRIIPGCPHGAPALELFRAALAAEGRDPEHVTVREVLSENEATALHFQGSPSFMSSDRDMFPAKSAPALSCRLYRSEGGVDGLPSAASLRAALRGFGSGA
ncbi:hypothetical protein [Arthrobacter sp. UYEF36]|uniref:hypothetical protein n=1 Tax=Arthrobacter sp. UYEF36 TaxID=1756366 RepID=UPI00339AEA45